MRNNEQRLGSQNTQQAEPMPVLNQVESLSFVTPTEIVDLPSKGLFYPEGHVLRNKPSVEIKHMTAKEEDILTNKSYLKKGIALDRLLESLIVDKNIDPSKLLISDRNAIFLAARISAYGNDYVTQITCPACDKKQKYAFDLLEKISESENLDIDEETDENGFFTIILPSTGWSVLCRALNGSDEKKLIGVVTNKTREEFTLLDQLKMLVVSVQGVSDPAVLHRTIESLPAKDSRYLRNTYDSVMPTLDLKNTFICSSCEYDEVVEVPLTTDFFWPKS